MGLFKEIFAWWTGNTWGTRLALWRAGAEHVGSDEFGNHYYRAHTGGQDERRWVIYARESEASLVPPLWHGWLHHQQDAPPTEQVSIHQKWQKPHIPNLTGTANAYYPPGSMLGRNRRDPATGDYEAWKPK